MTLQCFLFIWRNCAVGLQRGAEKMVLIWLIIARDIQDPGGTLVLTLFSLYLFQPLSAGCHVWPGAFPDNFSVLRMAEQRLEFPQTESCLEYRLTCQGSHEGQLFETAGFSFWSLCKIVWFLDDEAGSHLLSFMCYKRLQKGCRHGPNAVLCQSMRSSCRKSCRKATSPAPQ